MLIRSYTQALVDGFAGLNSTMIDDVGSGSKGFFALVSELRQRRFDLVFVVHPTFRLALMMLLAGIPVRVGTDDMRTDFATHIKLLPLRDFGPALSAAAALSLISDLRTLRTRVDAWSRNTMKVARWLEAHPAVGAVSYPGLASHPGHTIAARDFRLADEGPGPEAARYGNLLAFTVRGGLPAARRAFDRFDIIFRATDLGKAKSVAVIPSISTHQQQGEEGRAIAQVDAGLIRLSVGGEHPDDIIADLAQALEG